MKSILISLGSVVAGVLIYLIIQRLFPSPEDRIREQLNSFAASIQIEAEENPLKIAGKLRQLENYVSSDAIMIFQAAGANIKITGAKELRDKALQARPYFKKLRLRWKDEVFTQKPDQDFASLVITAIVEGRTQNGAEDFLEASPFDIEFVLAPDKTWKIYRIKNQKVLEFQ